jgi:hypothetical protein
VRGKGRECWLCDEECGLFVRVLGYGCWQVGVQILFGCVESIVILNNGKNNKINKEEQV